MGLVHRATLTPTKQELVESWLPGRSWGGAIADKLGEYRFDDPDGEVGVETILWRTDDGRVLQTPLTYRGQPLDGGDEHLIGEAEHSTLGRRWVYDGCGDPVWAATVATAILTGGAQAQMFLVVDGQRIDVPARMEVRGSGVPGAAAPKIASIDAVADHGPVTSVRAGGLELLLARVVGAPLEGSSVLTGTVTGADESYRLAAVRS
jgi:hypothetical protein